MEAALTISPTVSGKVEWGGNTLSFTPGPEGFARGQVYRVVLTDAAKSSGGLPLATPLDYRFQTVGYLEVAQVLPADHSTDVNMDSTVTVIFNRPVVPLTSLGLQASLPQPLTFMPPVTGQGEWLNTSIYSFKPDEGFAPSTTYKARTFRRLGRHDGRHPQGRLHLGVRDPASGGVAHRAGRQGNLRWPHVADRNDVQPVDGSPVG